MAFDKRILRLLAATVATSGVAVAGSVVASRLMFPAKHELSEKGDNVPVPISDPALPKVDPTPGRFSYSAGVFTFADGTFSLSMPAEPSCETRLASPETQSVTSVVCRAALSPGAVLRVSFFRAPVQGELDNAKMAVFYDSAVA